MTDGEMILVAGALLAAALSASLLAGRLRVPGLVLFLAIGMLIGSDGTGWIHFDDYELARTVGVIALALILFEGGLAAGFDEIRPVLRTSLSLAFIGTLVTAMITGVAAAWLFDFTLLEGLLLGSTLAATDGAAVFAILRGSTLRRRLARTLEGEAGFNDPVAILLVIGFIAWIQEPGYGPLDMAQLFAQQLAIGGAAGAAVGAAAVWMLRRTRLASAGLYPVASIAIVALAYGGAESLHGSGFLAAYLSGLWLGSSDIPAKRTITTFHAGLGWLAQVVLFLALGLLVFPSQLLDILLEGTLLAVIIAVVARPVAVFLSTIGGGFDVRERVVLGWAGLRGALPVVFATFPVLEGVPRSLEFLNLVFFAVLISTVIQGTTFEPLARLLGVTTSAAAIPTPLSDVGAVRRLGAEVVEYVVRPTDAIVGARVRELGLPRDALLNIVVRGSQAILPRGSTRVEANDRLNILVRQEASVELTHLMEGWKTGPVRPPRAKRPVVAAPRPFSSRPWPGRGDEGDAGHPKMIGGLKVIEQLRTRRDGKPGALVVLEDGRFAVTGSIVAVGSPGALQDAARRYLRATEGDAARAWWREVIGTLAAPDA